MLVGFLVRVRYFGSRVRLLGETFLDDMKFMGSFETLLPEVTR